jgi:hypothetical protein
VFLRHCLRELIGADGAVDTADLERGLGLVVSAEFYRYVCASENPSNVRFSPVLASVAECELGIGVVFRCRSDDAPTGSS